MYIVSLINENRTTIINGDNVNTKNRINGDITQGINTVDSFTFYLYPNNDGYNEVNELTTRVTAYNTKTGKYEFIGRVFMVTNQMNVNGEIYKYVTCESELGYFVDSIVRYKEYSNVTVREFLQDIIENHNQKVSADKHFQLGNVEFNNVIQREVSYDNTWNILKSRLINNENLGGEFIVRYENGIRYLDYVKQSGTVKTTTIELAKNQRRIESEHDPSNIFTRLVPLGAKATDSEERLTIESVNNGLDYLEDSEAVAKYGIIEKYITWDDVTLAENLLKRGQEYISTQNQFINKFKIDAVDLFLIGLDAETFEVRNYYPVVNSLVGINEVLRVVEKKISISNPESTTLSFGDTFSDANKQQSTSTQLITTTTQRVEEVTTTLNNQLTDLNSVKNAVNTNTNNISQNSTRLDNAETNINSLKNDVATNTTNINNNTTRLNNVESSINRINKRIMMEVF